MLAILFVFVGLAVALAHPATLSSCAPACKASPIQCRECIATVNRTHAPAKPLVEECTGQPCFETCTDPYEAAFWTCANHCWPDPYCEGGCYNFFMYDACMYCACGPCDCSWDDGNGGNTCAIYC